MDAEKKQQTVEHREHQERRFEDHDSGSTVHGDSPEETFGQGNVPDVDTAYASEIVVSKLKGRWLTWMVGRLSEWVV
jgi:hypothetical protein